MEPCQFSGFNRDGVADKELPVSEPTYIRAAALVAAPLFERCILKPYAEFKGSVRARLSCE